MGKKLTGVVVAGSIALLCLGTVVAQQQTARVAATHTIEVGQSLVAATAILREHRIEYWDGGFQVAASSEDDAIFGFRLNEREVTAMVGYSKSRRAITSISFGVHPSSKPGRLYETWLSAKRVTFESDGGYSVTFLPPSKEVRPKRESVYPPGHVR